MMLLRANGKDFTNFNQMGLSKSIDTVCDQFTATCTSDNAFAFPIPMGSRIQFLIEGVEVFSGEVEVIEGEYSDKTFSVSVMGRDDTKAIIKTDLKPKFSVRGPIQLKKAMERALSVHDIGLDVVDSVGNLPEFTKKEVFSDDVGSKIHELFNSMTSKRQVLLTKNDAGNLLIYRSGDLKYNTVLKTKLLDPDQENNILKGKFKFDNSELVREYNIHSRANITTAPQVPPDPTTGEFGPEAVQEMTATLGTAINEDISDGEFHKVAEHPSDFDECKRLAEWEANNARVKATHYNIEVPWLLIDGKPWEPGYIVRILDEVARIDSDMLITNVEYTASREGAKADEKVVLTLTIPDGYGTSPTESRTSRQTNRIGNNWKQDDNGTISGLDPTTGEFF